MSLESEIVAMLSSARAAARKLALASTEQKNAALMTLAAMLRKSRTAILTANRIDLERAHHDRRAGAFVERLTLNDDRIEAIARGVGEVAALPDPVGDTIDAWERPNGLRIEKRRVPIGVIAIIYESRPNVTVDAAVLCLKAGNAVVLRGGKEALASNACLAGLVASALKESGLDPAAATFIDNPDREVVQILKRHPEAIDLIIPRGGGCAQSRARRLGGSADAAFRRHLPYLRRRGGRPADGRRDLLQRQMQPPVGLQRDGNSAGASRRRGEVPARVRGADATKPASSCAATSACARSCATRGPPPTRTGTPSTSI